MGMDEWQDTPATNVENNGFQENHEMLTGEENVGANAFPAMNWNTTSEDNSQRKTIYAESGDIEIPQLKGYEYPSSTMGESSTKKKAPKWVWILLIILLVAVGSGAAATYFVLQGPLTVKKALLNLQEEIVAYPDPLLENADLEDIITAYFEGQTGTEITLNIGGIPNLPVTIGIDSSIARDAENRKMSMQNAVSVMNNKMADVNLYVDHDYLAAESPQFFDTKFGIYLNSIGADYPNSALGSMVGDVGIPEDFAVDLFPGKPNIPWISIQKQMFSSEFAEELKAIANDAEISKNQGSVVLELSDGNEQKCAKYMITIPKADCNHLIRMMVPDTEIRIRSDFSVILYINEKKEIVRITSVEAASVDTGIEDNEASLLPSSIEDLNWNIDLVGNKNTLDDISVKLNYTQVYANGSTQTSYPTTLECRIERTKEDSERFYHIAGIYGEKLRQGESQQGTMDYQFTCDVETNEDDGNFKISHDGNRSSSGSGYDTYFDGQFAVTFQGALRTEKDQLLDLSIKKFVLENEGETLCQVSGSIVMDQSVEKLQAIPSGVTNVMDMTLLDFIGIFAELQSRYSSIGDLLGTLNSLGIF